LWNLVSKLVCKLVRKFYKCGVLVGFGDSMKKYLLLVEDEELWARFKESIQKDINSEIMELIKEKVK